MTGTTGRWDIVMLPVCLVGFWVTLAACARSSAPEAIAPSRTPEVYVPTGTSTSVPPTPTTTPSPTPEPTPFVCGERTGHVVEATYPGAVLPREIPVRVYLPPCYDHLAGTFPSVILLHGKPFTESHWQDLGAVDVVNEGIRQGVWRPFIMIMPLQPEPLFSETDGGPESYEAELMQGLLPYVEGTFRTTRDPRARAIAGISRGGVWALEIGFRNPDAFGEVAALSPALAVNYARQTYDPMEIARSGAVNLPARIFLGAGDVDWARPKTVALADALDAQGITPELEIVSGDHASATWQVLMPSMFRYLTWIWGDPAP
jgi:enterochelin esterase-like enzyme